jgi:hypothetical protein
MSHVFASTSLSSGTAHFSSSLEPKRVVSSSVSDSIQKLNRFKNALMRPDFKTSSCSFTTLQNACEVWGFHGVTIEITVVCEVTRYSLADCYHRFGDSALRRLSPFSVLHFFPIHFRGPLKGHCFLSMTHLTWLYFLLVNSEPFSLAYTVPLKTGT